MKLTINMRLYQITNIQENLKQRNFAEFLLKIGNSTYPIIQDTENMVKLSSEIIIPEGNLTDLINFIYPNLTENSGNIDYMVGKAILVPKNVDTEKISDMVMNQCSGEVQIYPSADMAILMKDNNTE